MKCNMRSPKCKKIHELENTVLSPHRGVSPIDDLKRWDEQIENINRFIEGKKRLLNEVDLEEGY